MPGGYRNVPTIDRDVEQEGVDGGRFKPGVSLRLMSHIITFLSYTVFVCLFPVTYWVCVKNVEKTERIIIFRLGALIGSRGPGRVLVFPWIDRTLTVDVSNSAFSVPPQQLITIDGGIIEIGAEVHYAVTDCVALVREVADHQEMIRSLARTVLTRIVVKKTIQQLSKEKHNCGMDVMVEINGQVRKWGLDIRSVLFSDVKVLKGPENGIPPLLASLGTKPEGLSPADFAKYIYRLEEETEPEEAPGFDLQATVEAAEKGKLCWSVCLQRILDREKVERQAEHHAKYFVNISDLGSKLILEISATGCVTRTTDVEELECDVSLSLTSSDLAGILKGSLPPLQAYLASRIQVTGDVRKLMLLEKLSNKSHKPGETFSI